MTNQTTIQLLDAQGNALSREAIQALPVGAVIYVQRGTGPKVAATKLQ